MTRKSSQPRSKGGRFAPKVAAGRGRAKAPTRQMAGKPARLSILSALPWTWQLALGAGAIVLLLAIAGGIYAKGHADGYTAGYAKAEGIYLKLMADQAAANKSAIDAANKQLIETADQLDKTEHDLDAALTEIDAGSGGADAGELGLDAARMRSLGKIK